MKNFSDSEITYTIGKTLRSGHKVVLGTDWHLIRFDKETQQFYTRPDWEDIIRMQNEAVGPDDIFIFLGDLVDDEVPSFAPVYDLLGCCAERHLTGRYKFMVRGNNDTFSDDRYKDIGFDEVKVCIRYSNVLFSHVSVPLNFRRSVSCHTNIHGHMHRDGTPVDDIAYYHAEPYDNICICTDDCHPIDLADIFRNLRKEKGRNCKHVKGLEKAGMSRFLLNKSIETMIELFDID